uniref:Calnexin n=1 Tax=Strigamia maritima TaxID=126957 RepID=T1IU60_STRMM
MKKLKVWLLLVCLVLKCMADDESAEDISVDDVDIESDGEEMEDSVIMEEINYETPNPSGFYYFYESFDDKTYFKKRWVISSARKEDTDADIAKYDGKWNLEQAKENALKGDFGLVLKSKAKHHAIAVSLERTFKFEKKPLIVQYEVQFQDGQECGGGYLKLLSAEKNMKLAEFHDKTPYTIMFGPDKCGNDHKIHFIFRHKNPINGTITEKHGKASDAKLEEYFKDKKSHLYTLIVKSDNTFEIFVDQVSVNKGNMLEDVLPPVNPPKEIDDPYDRRPDDWDEREKIPDPNARKPEDWDEEAPRQLPDPTSVKPEDWMDDEPEMIPDPNAEKPSDWDEEMDGEWEAPLISNPKCEKAGCGPWKPAMLDNPNYKGKWRAQLIANPNYKGKWKPRKIPNADYFEDDNPFRMTAIDAVGLELWSMSGNILFDNVIISHDKSVVDALASQTWELKRKKADRESEGLFKRIIIYTNARPWLWAVYVVVIGLPIVLIFAFCCGSSETEKIRRAAAARAKKTDAATPDSEPETSNPVITTEPVAQETTPTIEEPEEKETETETEDKNVENIDKEEKEGSEEDAELSGSHDGSGDVGRSPRRRKPRRE